MSSEPKPPRDLRDHFRNLRYDLPAGLVVFLVALPLCLGIALASGAPPLAGIMTGLVGGMLVAWVSGSHTAVTGPAAGLIPVVLAAVQIHGYRGMLLATSIAGLLQIGFGLARLGGISRWFPSSVIRGMLVAIGLIVITEELPHALGLPADVEWANAFASIDPGALVLAVIGLGLIVLADRAPWLKKIRWLPGSLLAVVAAVMLNEGFGAFAPSLALSGDLLVSIPADDPFSALSTPDFSLIGDVAIWMTALTIALIASVETLLCTEALDSMDPFKRTTPTNRELLAQGTGNLVVGMLGGIPMTSLIVRGSTNVHAGARTRVSAFIHGALMLGTMLVLAPLLNRIPLAALAAVLLFVGFKLAHPRIIRSVFARSASHWVPFAATVVLVVMTDLLTGVVSGFGVALAFISVEALRARQPGPEGAVQYRIGPNVPWLSKLVFRRSMSQVEEGAVVEIDASDADPVHDDLHDEITTFVERARSKRIQVRVRDLPGVSVESR